MPSPFAHFMIISYHFHGMMNHELSRTELSALDSHVTNFEILFNQQICVDFSRTNVP